MKFERQAEQSERLKRSSKQTATTMRGALLDRQPKARRYAGALQQANLPFMRVLRANEKLFGQPRRFFLQQFRTECWTNPSQSASLATAPFRGDDPRSLY